MASQLISFEHLIIFHCLDGTSIYLSIHLLRDILVSSKCRQSWIKLPLTSVCRFSCGHNFSAPLGTYQGAWCHYFIFVLSAALWYDHPYPHFTDENAGVERSHDLPYTQWRVGIRLDKTGTWLLTWCPRVRNRSYSQLCPESWDALDLL